MREGRGGRDVEREEEWREAGKTVAESPLEASSCVDLSAPSSSFEVEKSRRRCIRGRAGTRVAAADTQRACGTSKLPCLREKESESSRERERKTKSWRPRGRRLICSN